MPWKHSTHETAVPGTPAPGTSVTSGSAAPLTLRQRLRRRLAEKKPSLAQLVLAILAAVFVTAAVTRNVFELIIGFILASIGLLIELFAALEENARNTQKELDSVAAMFDPKIERLDSYEMAVQAIGHSLPTAESHTEVIWSPFDYENREVRRYFDASLVELETKHAIDPRCRLRFTRYVDCSQVPCDQVLDHLRSELAMRLLDKGCYTLILCRGPLTGALLIDGGAAGIFVSTYPSRGIFHTLFIHGGDIKFVDLVTGLIQQAISDPKKLEVKTADAENSVKDWYRSYRSERLQSASSDCDS